MREYTSIVQELCGIAAAPKQQLERALASGKKAVGVMPYFAPEELVYAAGALPVGLWGADMQCSESRRYFPAFICSILHSTLEMGISGQLDGLSAIMIPISCDSLKGMGANWHYAVPQVPIINVAFAENRKIAAGVEFTLSQFKKIRTQLEKILDTEISDAAIASAIAVYNENRAALREFTRIVGEKPGLLSASERSGVIKAGYFMDRAEHTALVRELNAALSVAEAPEFRGVKVVLSGIMADCRGLLEVFDKNRLAVVADQLAYESVNFADDTPVTDDPIRGMAERLGSIEGASVLYDLGKRRCTQLAETAQASGADGVIFVLTKFCDPEEYDFVPLKRTLEKAGIPLLQIEIDRQMDSYGQISSAVEAFCETLA
ncbi:MAG: 2-hydroxyacyl-CoA dehydratase family protein [Oscillospiraceae bacterium]|nr:2-hydroxyacyl-CoA dehydratase family protein [Oscillospiraceae bacterium]